jgi:transglutaminase-like putative cysteine protease
LLGAISLTGYLIMPSADVPIWNPSAAFGASRLATGFGTEMDLNHQGKVELDEEVVIEIDAVDYSGRPTTIPLDQRFRAVELEVYRAGRWRGSATSTGGRGVPLAQPPLPALLVRQSLLNFRVMSREITTPVIADPALFLPVPAPGASRRGLLRRHLAYQQIVAEENKRDRSPLQDDIESRVRQEDLLSSPEALRPWAWELLESLADTPGQTAKQVASPLPLAELKEAQWRPARLPHGFFEESAQRLCRYLALGGDYTYTLDLDRTDPGIDPAVDFLKNTKRGHCERFASGLALMLRSVGVPARVVKGFRGCESTETGSYVIRNYHAHSWVEALVPKFENAPVRRVSWDWLTLDPTPGDSAVFTEIKPVDGWYGSVGEWLNQQQPLVNEFTGWWNEYGPVGIPNGMVPVFTVIAGIAAIFMLRRLRVRWIYAARGMAPRLRRLARRTGIRSMESDTPMEVAQALAALWRYDPFLAEYADLPIQLATEHYRLAYSGALPDRNATNDALRRLAELERIVWYSSRRRRRRLV